MERRLRTPRTFPRTIKPDNTNQNQIMIFYTVLNKCEIVIIFSIFIDSIHLKPIKNTRNKIYIFFNLYLGVKRPWVQVPPLGP